MSNIGVKAQFFDDLRVFFWRSLKTPPHREALSTKKNGNHICIHRSPAIRAGHRLKYGASGSANGGICCIPCMVQDP
jgi:hypothetical protein